MIGSCMLSPQLSGARLCDRAPLDILQFYAWKTQILWRGKGLKVFQGLMKLANVIHNIVRFRAGHASWVAKVVSCFCWGGTAFSRADICYGSLQKWDDVFVCLNRVFVQNLSR